jgi:hypothetical protein
LREFILEACDSNDLALFGELSETFPAELLLAEAADLGEQYRQQFEQLAQEWGKPKVGDLVFWLDCPASLAALNPFTVRGVEGDKICVDWVYHPIHFSRLTSV